jgi:esterase/lipase
MINKKLVLILHGWPQPIEEDNTNGIYLKYFRDKDYEVIAPKLFTRDFELTPDKSREYINQILNNKTPDVIVGISMGGLIAPVIAQDYPESKLVLIASNSKLKPDSKVFQTVLELAKNRKYLEILSLFRFLPQKVFTNIYSLFSPFQGTEDTRQAYLDDMKKNITYMLDIPVTEQVEIVKFVTSVDNTGLLKILENKTLIFQSKNDLLMSPVENENSLNNLLQNSILVETEGSHFNVFTEENFKQLDAFLD